MDGADTTPESLAEGLRAYLEACHAANPDTHSVDPGHRIPLKWPPHAVSHDFHVLPHDWTETITRDYLGEEFEIKVAQLPVGVFGRIEKIYAEAYGQDFAEMLRNLQLTIGPYLKREAQIAATLGIETRFEGKMRELPRLDLLKLLFCPDRDVAREAQIEIETHARGGLFTLGLIVALSNDNHPYRRVAQWCVLDMFEDLPTLVRDRAEEASAIEAIKNLIWTATDDYARTVYKAGVVLGGHICTEPAADALIACLCAPSKIGRRSAMHAVFHLVEWLPSRRGEVVTKLRNAAQNDPEEVLRGFASHMAIDIDRASHDHVTEPTFTEELTRA